MIKSSITSSLSGLESKLKTRIDEKTKEILNNRLKRMQAACIPFEKELKQSNSYFTLRIEGLTIISSNNDDINLDLKARIEASLTQK